MDSGGRDSGFVVFVIPRRLPVRLIFVGFFAAGCVFCWFFSALTSERRSTGVASLVGVVDGPCGVTVLEVSGDRSWRRRCGVVCTVWLASDSDSR